MPVDSLKLPAITVSRGRSPGSSPEVKHRSFGKRHQQQLYELSHDPGDHSVSLPRLFNKAISDISLNNSEHANQNFSELCSDDGGSTESVSGRGQDAGGRLRRRATGTKKNRKSSGWLTSSTTPIGHHRSNPDISIPTIAFNDGHSSTETGAPQQPVLRSGSYGSSASNKELVTFFKQLSRKSKSHQNSGTIEHVKEAEKIGWQEALASPQLRPTGAWDSRRSYLTTATSADSILDLFFDEDRFDSNFSTS